MANSSQLKNLIYKWIWAVWEGNGIEQIPQFYAIDVQGLMNNETVDLQKIENKHRLYQEKGSLLQVKILDLICEKDAFGLHVKLKSTIQDKIDENTLMFIGHIENGKIHKFWCESEKPF